MKLQFVLISCLLLLTSSVRGQNQECINGVQQCLSTLTSEQNKVKSVEDIHIVCQILGDFMKCVSNKKCENSESQKQTAIELAENSLKAQGINCDFKTSQGTGNMKKEGNSATTVMAAYPVAAVIVIIHMCFSIY